MARFALPSRLAAALTSGLIAALLAACGGNSTPAAAPTDAPAAAATTRPAEATSVPLPTAAATGEARLENATFAKKLGENQEPLEPTENFFPEETVYVSLEFAGRPEQGVVDGEFFWGDQSIAATTIDFASINSGVLFSLGQSTFAGFNLVPSQPLPVSDRYRFVATLDGKKLGEYPFSVVQPEGSLRSRITDAVLAKSYDTSYTPSDITDTFAPDEQVALVGRGDLGKSAWLKGELYRDGELIEDAVTTFGPAAEDAPDAGFAFTFSPDGAWSEASYEVVLYLNDRRVGSYPFAIGVAAAPTAPPAAATGEIEIGQLTTFSPPSGLFSIMVPETWQQTDNSDSTTTNFSWQDASGNAGLMVAVYEDPTTLSEADLTAQGEEFVRTAFGSEQNFEIIETTTQADGSVLIAWNAESDSNGAMLKVLSLTYIQQNDDKVTLLVTIFPDDQSDALWEAGYREIVNSYQIDTSVKVGK